MKKDLENLFRANQNKYSEKPSPAAWKKLNQRLENNRRNKPVFNPMVAAATIISLVGIIALLTLFAGKGKVKQLADNRPIELRELSPIRPDAKVKLVMEFTRAYHDRLSNPLGDHKNSK